MNLMIESEDLNEIEHQGADMWLMTQYGFYSIVKKGGNEFHIRGRVKDDLERLRTRAKLVQEVLTLPSADYKYRIIVNNEAYESVMKVIAESVTYDNFKNRVGLLADQKEKLHAYHKIWGILWGLQEQ